MRTSRSEDEGKLSRGTLAEVAMSNAESKEDGQEKRTTFGFTGDNNNSTN